MKHLVLIFAVCAISHAACEAVTIKGASSCGQWLNDRSTGNDEYVKTWLLGYLSGKAVAMNSEFLKNAENQSIYAWMDNYCKANPLKHNGDAAEELFIELAGKKR